MAQNISQMNVTGTFTDGTAQTPAWSVSDTSLVTIGAGNGVLTIQSAGKIWGGNVGVTATLDSLPSQSASIHVIASDSGSAAPRMPQLDVHWTDLGLSPWGAYGGLQEPSGSNCALSGSAPYTLTMHGAGAGVQYQQGELNWLRNFMIISGAAGLGMSSNSGTANAPDPNHASCAWLAYGRVQPGTSVGHLMGNLTAGINTFRIGNQNTSHSGEFEFVGPNSTTPGRNLTGPLSDTAESRVKPFLLVFNWTTGDCLAATCDSITLSASCSPFASTGLNGLGAAPGRTAGSGSWCYYASATGSIVEPLTNPQNAAAFLKKLGWTVSWDPCPTESGSISCPFLPYHWAGLGLQPWTATYNFQDTANPIATVDTWAGTSMNAWNLAINAVDSLRFKTPGWNRAGMMVTQVADHRAQVATIYGPPPLFDPTGSIAMVVYANVSGGVASNVILGVGGPNQPVESFYGGLVAGKSAVYSAGASATGAVTFSGDRVHPFMVVYDKTNSRIKFYNDMEKLTGSFNATAIINSVTASIGFGGVSQQRTAASGTYVWGALCTGTLAETFSDDGVASAFLKTLGWTIPW